MSRKSRPKKEPNKFVVENTSHLASESLKQVNPNFLLPISFARLTANKKFNEEGIKEADKNFIKRFFNALKILTSIKLFDFPKNELMKDVIEVSALYEGVYKNNGCGFELSNIDKFYSVKVGAPQHERFIGTFDPRDRAFYILAIDYHHDAYNHGS